MCDNISEYNQNPLIYRIASYDPALSEDYAVLTIGVAVKLPEENRFKVAMKNCYSLNTIGKQESSDKLLDRVVASCQENNIDMIIVDATAAQKDRARRLVEKLKQKNINTLVIPFSYSNQNKQRMMTALLDSISSSDLILPEAKYLDANSDYKELMEELLYLKVDVTPTGTITYKAPNGNSFHDDYVMSLAQLNYCCSYVLINRGKDIDLGDGCFYKLKMHRNVKTDNVVLLEQKTKRIGHWNY